MLVEDGWMGRSKSPGVVVVGELRGSRWTTAVDHITAACLNCRHIEPLQAITQQMKLTRRMGPA